MHFKKANFTKLHASEGCVMGKKKEAILQSPELGTVKRSHYFPTLCHVTVIKARLPELENVMYPDLCASLNLMKSEHLRNLQPAF